MISNIVPEHYLAPHFSPLPADHLPLLFLIEITPLLNLL